jgi:hypothetical protein
MAVLTYPNNEELKMRKKLLFFKSFQKVKEIKTTNFGSIFYF